MNLRKEVIVVIYIFSCVVLETYAKSVRIVGGTPGLIRDYPHMVSFRTFQNLHFCGGSIISNWHVISAGHCFYLRKNEIDTLKMYSGITRLSNTSGAKHEIDAVYYYPGFHWQTDIIETPHDICIVKVKSKIYFNEFTQKIKLPTRDIFNGNIGIVAGWGAVRMPPLSISDQLIKAPMTFYDSETCTEKSQIMAFEDQFCAFNSYGVGTCNGDSGGAVVSSGELYGIISLSYKCATGIPDVHTRVYAYLPWINHIIKTF